MCDNNFNIPYEEFKKLPFVNNKIPDNISLLSGPFFYEGEINFKNYMSRHKFISLN